MAKQRYGQGPGISEAQAIADIPAFIAHLEGLAASTTTILQTVTNPEVKLALQHLAALSQGCGALLQKEASNNSADEQERRRSLVFVGLPESTSAKPSERAAADRDQTTDILDVLGVEAQPVATYRLGRADPTKSGGRLLKVVLPASVFQHIALGQWKKCREKMRAETCWKRLIIRPSLTKAQLEEDRQKRIEFHKHGQNQRRKPPNTGMFDE
jgi:hypothetical protein